jgi:transposase
MLYAGAVGDQFILMDDNARRHRARVVQDYREWESIERMDWPARSADLKPIEQLWKELLVRIIARQLQLRTIQELLAMNVQVWAVIPIRTNRNLKGNMRRRF